MTVPRPRILLLGKIRHAQTSWEKLAGIADLVECKSSNRADFINECKSGALDGVVSVYRTGRSLTTTGRIDEGLVRHLPKSLRFISHVGAGYDHIDVHACAAAGIRVSNTPAAVDDATADTAIFLMLGALRNFWPAMTSLRQGKFDGIPPNMGHDPQNKVLGILGMGGIGRNMARKASVFDMKIQYYNRSRLSAEMEAECGGAKFVSFDDLLSTSDVLSLNLPLNLETRRIISTAEFARMKKGVVIVNTARGAVMDEAALVKALNDGIVSNAGLDVYEHEPEVDQGLIGNPNVILLPHQGTSSVETMEKMEECAMANVRRAVLEGKFITIVPEHKVLGWE